jgi:predicted ribosomally synthesized peptide with nif11-like leader
MSLESAVAFCEKLQNDEALIERINGMTPLEVQNLVRQEWVFEFTSEEMQQVIFERHPELTDEELEAVVGGSQRNPRRSHSQELQ